MIAHDLGERARVGHGRRCVATGLKGVNGGKSIDRDQHSAYLGVPEDGMLESGGCELNSCANHVPDGLRRHVQERLEMLWGKQESAGQ